MKNLELKKYNIEDLGHKKMKKVHGGWCSFAYDIGTALRMLSRGGPAAAALIASDIALYNANCN